MVVRKVFFLIYKVNKSENLNGKLNLEANDALYNQVNSLKAIKIKAFFLFQDNPQSNDQIMIRSGFSNRTGMTQFFLFSL